jgi:hypothetical protein
MFAPTVRDLCPDCIKKEEDDYALIKSYLKQNPGADVLEVSEATGVSEKRVLQMIRNGRLILDARVSCERCGRPIDSGRFCHECLIDLGKSLESLLQPPDVPSSRPTGYENGSKDDNSRFTKHFRK